MKRKEERKTMLGNFHMLSVKKDKLMEVISPCQIE